MLWLNSWLFCWLILEWIRLIISCILLGIWVIRVYLRMNWKICLVIDDWLFRVLELAIWSRFLIILLLNRIPKLILIACLVHLIGFIRGVWHGFQVLELKLFRLSDLSHCVGFNLGKIINRRPLKDVKLKVAFHDSALVEEVAAAVLHVVFEHADVVALLAED